MALFQTQVNVRIEVEFGERTLSILRGLNNNHRIETLLIGLERHMSQQDEKLAAFQTQMEQELAELGGALDNIATAQTNIANDEAALLAEIQALKAGADITPENQTILDGIAGKLGNVVERSKAQASVLQQIADAIPDAVPQTGQNNEPAQPVRA